ncbi:MAG: right-handed parallel beta-helix repeat-containing protein [Saccharofermentanales bacterium]
MKKIIIILIAAAVALSSLLSCSYLKSNSDTDNDLSSSQHSNDISKQDNSISDSYTSAGISVDSLYDSGFGSGISIGNSVNQFSSQDDSREKSTEMHSMESKSTESQTLPTPVKNAVQCVYVLNDNGSVANSVGIQGTINKIGRSDHIDVPDNVRCMTESPNPFQSAVDWAKANGRHRIYLDAGSYYNDKVLITSNKFAFHIPSGMEITGIKDSFGEPVSRLAVNEDIAEFYDLVVVGSESKNNSIDGQMDDFLFMDVMIDGRTITNVGIWTTGGDGTKYINVHAKNINISALILGRWNSYSQDPSDINGAAISWARNFEIRDCHIHSCGGDGIAVLGKDGEIFNNRCDMTTSLVDNGITLFSSSQNVRIYNNTLKNFPTGIGLDGTYLLLNDLQYKDQAQAYEIWANKLWGGYNQNISIYKNNISNCKNGISLYRSKDARIYDNIITPPVKKTGTVGITLNESFGAIVWNNKADAFNTGLWLWSYTNSCIVDGRFAGCSLNTIGLDMNGEKSGNSFKDCAVGILLSKGTLHPTIRNNQFCYNDFTGSKTAADWSGGDDGEGRQYSFGNIYPTNPGSVNYSTQTQNKVRSG